MKEKIISALSILVNALLVLLVIIGGIYLTYWVFKSSLINNTTIITSLL